MSSIIGGAFMGFGQALTEIGAAKRRQAEELLRRETRAAERTEDRRWQQEDLNTRRQWQLDDEQRVIDRENATRKRHANVYQSLFGTESGGNFGAANSEGYVGRSQFGQDRLDDFTRATGRGHLNTSDIVVNKGDSEAVKKQKAELQKKIEKWHFADVNDYIDKNDLMRFEGQTIGGVKMTRSGMIAMAHLGGSRGMEKFLTSGGKYNPSDSNGTSLRDYARSHGGLSTDMIGVWDVVADPDTPAALRAKVLEKATGKKSQSKLTGEEWVADGKGNEVLMGRVDGTSTMRPYVNDVGKTITRKAKNADVKLSAQMEKRVRDRFKDEIGGGYDPQKVDALRFEVLRLMQDEGLSESQAEQKAVRAMVFEETTTNRDGFLGFGRSQTTTTNTEGRGVWNGEFEYGGEAASQAGHPSGSDGQVSPPKATTSGQIATPKTKEEYDALPSGTKFKAPDGSTRIKP